MDKNNMNENLIFIIKAVIPVVARKANIGRNYFALKTFIIFNP